MELQYKRGDLIPADIFAAQSNGIPVTIKWASNVSITKRDDGTHLIHRSDGPLIDMSAECEHGGIMCNGHGTVIDGHGFPDELRSRGIQALLFKTPQKGA